MSWLQQERSLSLSKVQQQEPLTQTCSSCTHSLHKCISHPIKKGSCTESRSSQTDSYALFTCGVTELLTLLTAAEVKTGFKVPAKQELAAHLRRVD